MNVIESSDSQAAEREPLATAIASWLNTVRTKAEWISLPAVAPGDLPRPLNDVYVELHAIECPEESQTPNEVVNLPVHEPGTDYRRSRQYQLGVSSLLARTRRRAIIVGEPGAGKSTLVKWIVQVVSGGQLRDFDLALVVSLGQFAASLKDTPDTSLLAFFLQTHCSEAIASERHPEVVQQLQTRSRDSGRTLLLLDGWDEVPVDLRKTVAKRILEETQEFIILVTSRPSGLPRRFVDGGDVVMFELAGLSERSIEELAMRQFRQHGRPDLLASFRQQLALRADLRTMAANPFLLTMLCRIEVERRDNERLPGTLAGVYERFVEWIRSHYNQERRQKGQPAFESGHLKALAELSYDCFFTSPEPGYLFRFSELESFFGDHGLTTEPVTASRLVNRVSAVWDEHAFIHATLHEYFAGAGLAQMNEDAIGLLFQLAVFSDQRFQVFRFAAGMRGKHSSALWLRVREEADFPDRFGIVWLRIARLVEAAGLTDGATERLGFDVRDRLWQLLRDDSLWYETQSLVVATYATLDSRDLARRLVEKPDSVPTSAVQRIILHVPWRIGIESGLHSLVQQRWPHYVESTNPGGVTDADIEECRRVFALPDLDEARRLDAVNRLGALRDHGAVPALVRKLNTCQSDKVIRRIIFALAHIGGRRAVDSLVEGLLNPALQEYSDSFQVALQVEYIGAIDPEARDAILDRVAAMPVNDPRLPAALNCLRKLPVLDGAGVVLGCLQSTTASSAVRVAAANVLKACRNSDVARVALELARDEGDTDVRTALYGIASRHDFPEAVPWLRAVVLDSTRSDGERSEVLNALNGMAKETRSPDCLVAIQRLLTDLASRFLEIGSHELDVAIFDGAWLFDPVLDGAMIPALDRFSSDLNETSVNALRLICVALRVRELTSASDRLVALVYQAHAFDQSAGGRTNSGELAKDAVFALLQIAPKQILVFDPDLRPVRTVLAQWCHQTRSLVFADRIIDSTGRIVARREQSSLFRQAVKSRRLVLLIAVAGQIAIALIVGENDQDVRLLPGSR